ncbi:MAG: arsenosugar biosynthesis arsenite methyltransferase ArsM [Gemmataceae bacterium]|nr:arsenosugar biosynthesis arsenite methyltransferase ArsM [Gemmataceae bacterium]
MSTYLQTIEDVYAAAARQPDQNLCCTSAPVWRFPDLAIPPAMLAMNYGCGATVEPRDLRRDDTILYVGVGGGLEALQFAYFTRRPGGVIAVDPVADMRAQARKNFDDAARVNPWFQPDFVTILDGNALDLPVPDGSVRVAAQNCLFNVFRQHDLDRALGEVARALKPGGLFATSDPIAPAPLPEAFRANDLARAHCLSGCQTFDDYLAAITGAGFGRVEVRSRVPYRLLTPHEFPELREAVMLESVEIAAYKMPDGPDGAEIFTGRTATYAGREEAWDDGAGHVLPRGVPVAISDAAAGRLARQQDVTLTPPTYSVRGAGCC